MTIKTVVLTLLVSSASLLLAHPLTITSQKKYDSLFPSTTPMITMYTSPSCGPCRQMKPDFYKASDSHPDIQFCIVDISNPTMRPLAQKLQIQSIPTLVLSCNGKIIARTRGRLTKKELEQEITQFKQKIAQQTKKSTKKSTTKKPKNPVKATIEAVVEAPKKIVTATLGL